MEFAKFILKHEGEDTARLALSRARYAAEVEDLDLALHTLECRARLKNKLPEWYALPGLHYPSRLSAEQCSSSETARYKASIATGSSHIADLTGGLGVDSWAFAQVAREVLYNEMQPGLAVAAEHKFRELGIGNIKVQNQEVKPGNLKELLGGFRPDLLYLDPARRAADGRKVFRLEDCRPDVLQLLPELLEVSARILVKLSPMADIDLVCKQLGCVKEVHVVAAEKECKELLLLLERGYAGKPALTLFESGYVMQVGEAPPAVYAARVEPGQFLFEPGKALLKAGAFTLPCRYGLQKLSPHTHLYVSEGPEESLKPFGKWFIIKEVLPFDKRSFRDLGKRYPRAEVTARDLPMSSEELRARTGCRSGGTVHIYGVRSLEGPVLIVTDS